MSGDPSQAAVAAPNLSDDPDASLRETQLDSQQVYRGHFLDVRRDRIRLPDGTDAGREYIVHPGAVMVVPILADGRLVIERQWRYPLARAIDRKSVV